MNENREHGLIFFDGICNLCNHTVQFIIKRDKADYFRFAALQSEVARDLLKKKEIEILADLKSAEPPFQEASHQGSNQNREDLSRHNSKQPDQEKLNTIVLLENGKAYYRSTAALRIAKKLSGIWPLFYGLIIIPAFIRDFFYTLISRNRYRIWGKQESCMVPDANLASKFL